MRRLVRAKVWHSTDKYRRTIYRCNDKFKSHCKTPHLTEDDIKEAFVRIENGEVFVYGMHISPYEKGNIFNKDPLRVKKLLMHRYEINKLMGKIKRKRPHPGCR